MMLLVFIIIGWAGVYFVLPFIVKALMRHRFRAMKRKEGAVCLTFDDGPDPVTTPEILLALSQSGARATFFLLGKNAEAYPELTARIVSEGHEVGEHSYSHMNPFLTGPTTYLRDLNRGRRILASRTEVRGHALFRPPWGKLNAGTLIYIILHRRRVILWDLDPKDYATGSSQTIAEFVTEHIRSGQILLLHDGRYRKGGPLNGTPAAVRMILKEIGRRGLSAVTVSEILMQHPVPPGVRAEEVR
jgi:peptidoglycan/xylan/chitin deacetylase (PgdA/CDA1 family)